MNNVGLVGRITKDPELQKTPDGVSVVKFTLAVNRNFESQQDADFIRVEAWRHTADFLSKYIKKGALLSVEGRIQTGSFQDQDGKTVYTTDVVARNVQQLESREQIEARENAAGYQQTNQRYNNQQQSYQEPPAPFNQQQQTQQKQYDENKSPAEYDAPELDISSDDLPF